MFALSPGLVHEVLHYQPEPSCPWAGWVTVWSGWTQRTKTLLSLFRMWATLCLEVCNCSLFLFISLYKGTRSAPFALHPQIIFSLFSASFICSTAGFKYTNTSWLFLVALMCIVKPEGSPQLCKTDEIGEIVINSRAGGTMYYGLPGVTKNTFEVCPMLLCSLLDTLLHQKYISIKNLMGLKNW